MTKTELKEALATWPGLNSALRDADEARCRQLLQAEADGKRRHQFLLRIHSRLNKARAGRERLDLRDLIQDPARKAPDLTGSW